MTIDMDYSPTRRPQADVGDLTGQVVSHFLDHVAARRTQLGDAISGEITAATRMCAEIGRGIVDGRDVSDKLGWLSTAAAGWAREGLPIDTIVRAFHEALRLSLDAVYAAGTTYDRDTLTNGLRAALAVSNLMSTTMISAYLDEYRLVVGEHHTAIRTVTSALLAGRATTTMARESGVHVAENYRVIGIAIPRSTHDRPPDDEALSARRRLHRIRAALAHHGDSALAMLSVDGGTVLIPGEDPDDAELDALIESLSTAARVDVVAAVIPARTGAIPDAVQRAHELLDIVVRLGYTARLYRFEDLALEYQLTRPGPGLAELGELLAPLDAHPELSETLRVHIANDLNRQRTARHLHLHTNTVVYRLRRIANLTGLDATHTTGLWRLKSAVVARAFHPSRTA
ncbi:PucR family transcriptional regulator [Nocardia mangyaensis]|uniref:PucR family transcriptional regulator n=1 Tax=Nocardia mangyaensis TaxID=2213200 RepID=UPI0026748B09|nr:helix-turn-helix domain-containing protein [Nocardia mangyaensis]MDO3647924.1 helix-turn-helix domain-containing protein [Nocardia mangyaensis]